MESGGDIFPPPCWFFVSFLPPLCITVSPIHPLRKRVVSGRGINLESARFLHYKTRGMIHHFVSQAVKVPLLSNSGYSFRSRLAFLTSPPRANALLSVVFSGSAGRFPHNKPEAPAVMRGPRVCYRSYKVMTGVSSQRWLAAPASVQVTISPE